MSTPLRRLLRAVTRQTTPPAERRAAPAPSARRPRRWLGRERRRPAPSAATYPGDYDRRPSLSYAPSSDGDPDPGEVVWAWVPFEDDHGRGKDRPVLLIGRDGPWLLGLPMTSQDHDRDAAEERARGREWLDVGPGDWDAQGRPSEVRLDRIVRVDPAAVRRQGSVLPRRTFEEVAAAVRGLRP